MYHDYDFACKCKPAFSIVATLKLHTTEASSIAVH